MDKKPGRRRALHVYVYLFYSVLDSYIIVNNNLIKSHTCLGGYVLVCYIQVVNSYCRFGFTVRRLLLKILKYQTRYPGIQLCAYLLYGVELPKIEGCRRS